MTAPIHPADAPFTHGDEGAPPAPAPAPAAAAPPPAAPTPPAPVAAAPAPRPAPATSRIGAVTIEDKVEYLSGRRIRMTINNERFDLRAPTHPEYKQFRQTFNKLAADGRAATLAGEAMDQADDVYEIVISAINAFSAQPWTIAPDVEPPWLESAKLVRDMLAHWAEVPGSPG